LKAAAEAHSGTRLELWFQDEARVGNKGRVCHRWWRKGQRAPGPRQIGYQWAYIFTAVRPATGEDFTLVLPAVNAKVMDLFLARFAATRPDDSHVVMFLDGAGWHDQRALTVRDNLTLVALPSYSPELNPVERVWLYLRERFLSLRVLDDTEAIIDACCQAWNALTAEPDRLRSLCAYPWIVKVSS
jgi:transposase